MHEQRPSRLSSPIRFGDFVFEPRAGELRHSGGVERLGEKPAAALEALLAEPGAVVDRQTLRQHLWPDGTVVDFDNNLNAAIKKLRDAVGDHAESPRFIETLPRRGYRFIAATSIVSAADLAADMGPAQASEPAEPRSPAAPPADSGRRRWLRAVLVPVVSIAAVALIVFAAVRLRHVDADLPSAPMLTRERLVVLPFVSLVSSLDTAARTDPAPDPFAAGGPSAGDSGTPQWLRDGLTEELITQLGRLAPSRLGVIARHSAMKFRDAEFDLGEIGRRLDVAWAIEGSVATADGRAWASVRLVRTDDQTVVWADRYESSDGTVAALVRRVASGVGTAIADQLLADDSAARLRAGTASSAAYEAFLVGRAAWYRFDDEGYREALEAFHRALEADPEYAPAHAALADTYNLLAFSDVMPRADAFAAAESAAHASLARDPNLAMAHNALGFARLYGRFDVGGSLSHFARAVALDPNDAMIHHLRAGALAVAGRADEAVASARRSLALDPLSLSVRSDLGWYLIYADQFEEARSLCREALVEHADDGWSQSCFYEASRVLGDLETAVGTLTARRRVTAEERAAWPAIASPDPAVALEALDQMALERLLAEDEPHALTVAELAARLGDRDRAFAWLERAFEAKDPWLIFIPVQPFFDPLHGDPRLDDLIERLGLPNTVRRALSSASASG